MNDTKKEADRFHEAGSGQDIKGPLLTKLLDQLKENLKDDAMVVYPIGRSQPVSPLPCPNCPSIPAAPKRPAAIGVMTFLPIGKQMYDTRNFKLTDGKDYPILEKSKIRYGGEFSIKTVDDAGKEVWMKDEYFVPAKRLLMHDKDLHFSDDPRKNEPTLEYFGKQEVHCLDAKYPNPDFVPDVRKLAKEAVTKKELVAEEVRTVAEEELKTENLYLSMMDEYKVLSGINVPERYFSAEEAAKLFTDDVPVRTFKKGEDRGNAPEEITLKAETTREELEKNKDKTKAPLYQSEIYQSGCNNPLLMNMDKLIENLGKVFPEYRTGDTEGMLDYIQKKIPGHTVAWDEGVFSVDGAKTNIKKVDVNVAFDGLKKMTSPTMADKLIGKIIVRKLKKLF